MNKIVDNVNRSDLVRAFLVVCNWYYQLSKRELDILESLVNFDIEYDKIQDKNNLEVKNIISSSNRRLIMNKLGVTADNLCRYISKFKDMGIVVSGKKEDEHSITRDLIPNIVGDRVVVSIVLKIKNNGKDCDK